MNLTECAMCQVAAKTLPSRVFYENERTLATLASEPTLLGHALVVWKAHVLNASDLALADCLELATTCHQVEAALLGLLHKDRAVLLKSGGKCPHLHHHIYPMNQSDSWDCVQDAFNNRNIPPHTPEDSETLYRALCDHFTR